MKSSNMIQDARRFHPAWRLWFVLLQIVNLVSPLFFLGHVEAWAVLAGYLVAAVVMVPLHRKLGWVRLLGVGHFAWFVILPWLVFRYLETAPTGAFGIWLLAVIVINGICLLIDIVDVARYLAGDRKPTVAAGT